MYISQDGKWIYHIGIIDFLQDFNLRKQGENFLKVKLLGGGEGVSAVPPKKYAARFLRFMRDNVVIDQKASKNDNTFYL